MADVKWIKITTDIFDNRKIRQIESMPEGDSIIVIWLKLLILAGDVNDNGFVYFTKDIPYTDQLLSTQFNRPLSTIQLALTTFREFGMIEVVDDVICVSNWEKYQNIETMNKIREQTRKRVAKHRELKRLEASNVTCNVTVTQSNATEIEREEEKDIEDIIIPPIVPPTDKAIDESDLSEPVKEKLKEWVEYKRQRKNKYTSMGLKSLITTVHKKEQAYGASAVIDVIDLSMSNQWQGILWDKISQGRRQGTGQTADDVLRAIMRGEE